MSDKIKFFSLGGLDENGKNMSIIEINNDIYVFDAGIKFPDKRVPGVDCIIPNYNYLKENASRVKGYIISHAHDDQMGALPYIYRKVPAPIYCSSITAELIKNKTILYGLKPIDYDFHIVSSGSTIIDGREFIFFKMTHSVPGNLSVAIDTSDGYIVYTSDFIIDFGASKLNRMDFTLLTSLPLKKKILLLITESCDAEKSGHASPNHRITQHIQRLFSEAKGRIFISIYSQNLFNLQEVIDLGIKTNKKIIFLNNEVNELFSEKIISQLFTIPQANKATINDLNRIREQDTLIIINGTGEHIFENIIALSTGSLINNITFSENDTFIVASPSVPGTETISIEAVDDAYKTGAHVVNLTRKDICSMHAHEEDLKMLLTMLAPKYYLPIKGDFRQLMANAKIALSLNMGYNHNNIFIFDNGMILNIEDGIAKPDFKNTIENGDVLVDGIGVGNVVDSVIQERISMATDGIVILGGVVSSKNKKILASQDVQMRGFVFLKDSEKIVKQINSMFDDALHTYISNYYQDKKEEFINKIADRISKYIRKETKKQPIVIPNIIDVDEI